MDNLGERIRKQREAKNMTIEDLSKETLLSVAILKDIEAGKFDRYEGEETYVKMYLKKICEALDMDREEVTQSYIALTQEIKVAQLNEQVEQQEKNNKKIVKEGRDFKFDSPGLSRSQSVYENKSHVVVIRTIIIIVLVALIIGVLWWGISSTKSKVQTPEFNEEETIVGDGDIVNDDQTTTDEVPVVADENDDDDKSASDKKEKATVKFEKNDQLDFDFTLPDDAETFTFKVEYANDSWCSMTVNGKDYSEFESRTYKEGETIELTFSVDDFETLDLKNGYSMGHSYYINDEEIPLEDDDYSESITHLILTLK